MRIGDSRLVFGVSDEVWGYVQNIKEDVESEKGEAKNGAGQDVAVEKFNVGKKTVTGTYLWLSDQTGGPIDLVGSEDGLVITNVDGTIYIDNAGKARAMGEWCMIDFSGTHYPHLVMS